MRCPRSSNMYCWAGTQVRSFFKILRLFAVTALFGALRPLWLEDAPLTEGAASWMALLPQARDALQRHGWTALPHEQGFSRTDALGRRRDFHFGHTSLRVLRQWLEEAFVSQGVHKCGRVRDGFHRPDPACAGGLEFRPSQTP